MPKKFIKYAFFLALIIYLIYFFLFSAKFAIKDILVEGTSLLTKDQITEQIPLGQNIFRFDIDGTEKTLLSKYPEIKYAAIYRGIPDAVKVVIVEREGKIVWQSGDSKYLISSQGEAARKIVGDEGKDLPVIVDQKGFPVTPGAQLVSPNFIAFITNIYSSFFQEENIKPLSFQVEDTTFDVNLVTDAGFYVKLNSLRSSKKQLDNLKLVLVQKRADIHEYVDLRIDGWAYYK